MIRPKLKSKRYARQRGFTLTEVMAAVFIIGLLSVGAIVAVVPLFQQSNATAAKTSIATIESALEMYALENFDYPSQSEGLSVLLGRDGNERTGTEYLRRLPDDPWGQPYVYERPGDKSGRAYDLYSLGADGKEGGEDENADIGNWDQ
ncbi:MAG: type II secretion system major pseudopilin GspG [Pseudomonadota bacterium]